MNVTDVYEAAPNNPPVFTTSAFVNVPENQSFATDVNATDSDGDPLSYSITGGADQAKFDLNSTTGILTFKIPPDFEANASAAGNNAYLVNAQVSDGTATANQTLTINVTDLSENTTLDFRGQDISSLDLSGQDLSGALFNQTTIFSSNTGGQIQGVNLSGTEANLSNLPLMNVDFRGVNLAGVNLSNSDLNGALFDQTTIFSSSDPALGFHGQSVGANLANSDPHRAPNLSNLVLMHVDFRGVNLAGVNLSNSDLFGAIFDQTTIFSSSDPALGFHGHPSGANLSNNDPVRAANLSNLPLMNVDFRGVNLAGVNLSNSDLNGALFDQTTIFSSSDPALGFHGHPAGANLSNCLLYTSPSPRDATLSRMPSSA